MLFDASRHGIERLEVGESEQDKNPKIITLENCVKIAQETGNLIYIVTKTEQLTLNTQSEEDLKTWLTALQNVAFKEKLNSSQLSRNNSVIEDNDLYCSSYGDGIFVVNLMKSDTSQRCNIPEKTYKLSLTPTELQLVSFEDEKKIIAKWPYRFIRKYGYRDGHFTFEAGRKCDTGEGSFSLDHANPQEIFRCMATKMKSMKKLLNGENVQDCSSSSESQLNVVISSMEAGSRSPIPQIVPTSSSEFELNSASSSVMHQSFASIRGFLSSADSLSNVSTTSSSIPLLKHIPNKPPRKTMQLPSDDYEVPELPKRNASQIREYESIETITDAWKTLGIDEVRHTENVKEKDLIDFSWSSKKDLMLDGKIKTVRKLVEFHSDNDFLDDDNYKVVDEEQRDSHKENAGEDNYDKLEYFRSNSKTSSAYKTVIPITASVKSSTPSSSSGVSLTQLNQKKPTTANDDYEIIGNPDMQTCRLADDRSLGYGVLRKTSLPSTTNSKAMLFDTSNEVLLKNSSILLTDKSGIGNGDAHLEILGDEIDVDDVLSHRKFNGLDYAIVSKPKRV